MVFIQAVKYCFQNYRDFTGRASRAEFWYFFLFSIIVLIMSVPLHVIMIVLYSYFTDTKIEEISNVSLFIIRTIQLITLSIPFLSVLIRRIHDIGITALSKILLLSAIFISLTTIFIELVLLYPEDISNYILYVSYITVAAILILLCVSGTNGPNEFGPESTDVFDFAVISKIREKNKSYAGQENIRYFHPLQTIRHLLISDEGSYKRITVLQNAVALFYVIITITFYVISSLSILTCYLLYYFIIKKSSYNSITITFSFIILAMLVATIALVLSAAPFVPCTTEILKARLRDAGINGKYYLLPFIPAVIMLLFRRPFQLFIQEDALYMLTLFSFVIPIITYCIPGTKGPNRYGPDPRAPKPAEAE